MYNYIIVFGGRYADSADTNTIELIDVVSGYISTASVTLAWSNSFTTAIMVNYRIYCFGGIVNSNRWQYIDMLSVHYQ